MSGSSTNCAHSINQSAFLLNKNKDIIADNNIKGNLIEDRKRGSFEVGSFGRI
jgi:hypothetical protein